jgi:predicted permease
VQGATLDLALDPGLAAFVIAVSAATGVLVGLAPALQASRPDTVSALKGAGLRRGARQQWLRGGLVTAQVAIAIVLLFGMGLFARALGRALAIDPGYDPAPLAALAMDPSLARIDGGARFAYYAAATERAAAAPGVSGVTWTTALPLTSDYDRQTADIPGYVPGPEERVRFEFSSVGPDFHAVMGIPLLAGRGFDARDAGDAEPVALINETAAKRYFAGRDPIGADFVMGGTTIRIIGVARDIRHHELVEEPRPYAWFPLLQTVARGGGASPVLIVRTAADPARVLPGVVEAVRAADPRVPVFASITLADHLRSRLAPQVAGAWLLGAFGALGLVVAAVGIYGIIAYAVSMRAREIGLRMALGARLGDVLRLVVIRNLAFAAAGIPLGLALALLLSRGLQGFLFGVPAHDPLTVAACVALMLAIATAASSLPARRAARIDPLVALRSEG